MLHGAEYLSKHFGLLHKCQEAELISYAQT